MNFFLLHSEFDVRVLVTDVFVKGQGIPFGIKHTKSVVNISTVKLDTRAVLLQPTFLVVTHEKVFQHWCEGTAHGNPVYMVGKISLERKMGLGSGIEKYLGEIFPS